MDPNDPARRRQQGMRTERQPSMSTHTHWKPGDPLPDDPRANRGETLSELVAYQAEQEQSPPLPPDVRQEPTKKAMRSSKYELWELCFETRGKHRVCRLPPSTIERPKNAAPHQPGLAEPKDKKLFQTHIEAYHPKIAAIIKGGGANVTDRIEEVIREGVVLTAGQQQVDVALRRLGAQQFENIIRYNIALTAWATEKGIPMNAFQTDRFDEFKDACQRLHGKSVTQPRSIFDNVIPALSSHLRKTDLDIMKTMPVVVSVVDGWTAQSADKQAVIT